MNTTVCWFFNKTFLNVNVNILWVLLLKVSLEDTVFQSCTVVSQKHVALREKKSDCPYLDWDSARQSSILHLVRCYSWGEAADWEVHFQRWILCWLIPPNITIYIFILLMWTNQSLRNTIVRAQTLDSERMVFQSPPLNASFL